MIYFTVYILIGLLFLASMLEIWEMLIEQVTNGEKYNGFLKGCIVLLWPIFLVALLRGMRK